MREVTTTTYTNNLGETITLTVDGFVAGEDYATSAYAVQRRNPSVGENVILETKAGYRVVTIERETKAQVFVDGIGYWKATNAQFFRTAKKSAEFGVLYFAGSANGFEFALTQLSDEEKALLSPAVEVQEEEVQEEAGEEAPAKATRYATKGDKTNDFMVRETARLQKEREAPELDEKTEEFLAVLDGIAHEDAKLGVTIARRWAECGIATWTAALREQAGHLGLTVEDMLKAAGEGGDWMDSATYDSAGRPRPEAVEERAARDWDIQRIRTGEEPRWADLDPVQEADLAKKHSARTLASRWLTGERHLANARRLSLQKPDGKLDAFVGTQTTAALKLEVQVQRDRRKAQVRAWKRDVNAGDEAGMDVAAQAIAELERRERAILRELKRRGVQE